ncbi:MAG: hypothetical protein JWN01_956 [Patescibacteria group bacterium]|jgi:lipopolysaccharide biosynthesis regulator YciM|nr:hypothetical protein [Patescibacteria group bacterium]
MPRVKPKNDTTLLASMPVRLAVATLSLGAVAIIAVWAINQPRQASEAQLYQDTLKQAAAAEHDQNFSRAAAVYRDYLKTGHSRPQDHQRIVYIQLASVEGEDQHYQAAITALRAAAKLPPGEDQAIIQGLASNYDLVGDKAKAITYYKLVVEDLRKNPAPGSSSKADSLELHMKDLR